MSATAAVNPDAGARVVSPAVALSETAPAGAHPTFTLVEPSGGRAIFGFGDGTVRALSLTLPGAQLTTLAALGATPLTAAVDLDGLGIVAGTDDGRVLSLAGGGANVLATEPGEWIEAVATHMPSKRRAYVAGRTLVVLDAAGGETMRCADHPSTLAGMSFSPDGQHVAVAHYGGVSVWNVAEAASEPVLLEWHGSHTAVAWSPDGAFIVTAMQDKEVHCWRWADRKSMRMSGYPSKIRSLSWTADGRYVAASGADTVTSWDCSGKGPSGKPPLEFGYVYNGVVMQVAAHPKCLTVAGGYSDGTVLIGEIETETAVIARPGNGDAIAGLAWTADGRILVGVDVKGAVAVMRMQPAMA